MPDKKSKIKFNPAYLASIEEAITRCRTMYNKINPKIKYLHINNLTRSIRALQSIKDYAAFNGVQIPRKPYGLITHDAAGHRFLANGAQAIKELRNATQATAAKLGAKALDCVVLFDDQLP